GSAKSTMASDLDIVELEVDRDSVYANKTIAEIPRDEMARVLLIERGKEIVIPKGNTTIAVGDILVIYRLNE
ncbi:TrkA C-terminal domain-containing protein, partial [Oribacterium sinus]